MWSVFICILFVKKIRFVVAGILACLGCLIIFAASSEPLLKMEAPDNVDRNLTAAAAYSKSTLGLYDISTFDIYADGENLHVLVGGKNSVNDPHISIRYTRSGDGGQHWIDPIILNNRQSEIIASRGNDIQLAAKGKYLVALWQTKGNLPGMGPVMGVYSQDKGESWQQSPNPAGNNDGSQAHIDLIADQLGNFHVVWLEDPEENGHQSLRYAQSTDSGKQWSQPVTLDGSSCSCCPNTFALSPKNELSILYRDMTPRDMSLMQSSDGGQTWQGISTVGDFRWNFNGCPHTGGGLKYVEHVDAAQLHSIVWTGIEDKPGLYHLSSNNNGQTWTIPTKLGEKAIHGDIAVHDSRNITAIWNEMEADGLSIFYATSENGGASWLTPKRLTKTDHTAIHPKLVSTPQGVLAMWTERPIKQPSRLAWQMLK